MYLDLDYGEDIILASEDAYWTSRNNAKLDRLVLTNKRLYFAYQKKEGALRLSHVEEHELYLNALVWLNGRPVVQRTTYKGKECLQIQFDQGSVFFHFKNNTNNGITQWIKAVNHVALAANSGGYSHSDVNSLNNRMKSEQNTGDEFERVKVAYCAYCDTKLSDKDKFCTSCGAPTINKKYKTIRKRRRTSSVKGQNQSQSVNLGQGMQYDSVGIVCPNCGYQNNISSAMCVRCGYQFRRRVPLYSVRNFQEQMMLIENKRQFRKKSFWNSNEILDETDKEIIALIKSYPIPDTIEELSEFFFLTIGNIDVVKSKKYIFNLDDGDGESREREISNAWVGKLQALYAKAELYYSDRPEFEKLKSSYISIMRQMRRR